MLYALFTACLTAADLVTKKLARADRRIRKIYNSGFSLGVLREHPLIVKGIPTAVGVLSAVKWVQTVMPGGTDGHQGTGKAGKTEAGAATFGDAASAVLRKTAYSMILAGAIGNTYERIARGYVTDFINIPKGRLKKYFFNIADLCVVVGAFFMTMGELTEK